MRARSKGWRHLLCADTFVYHAGGVSFGEDAPMRKQSALERLSQRYPDYNHLVGTHIKDDPARLYRQRATLFRLQSHELPLLLFITHNRGGGTQRHIQHVIQTLRSQAHILILIPSVEDSGVIELRFENHLTLYFQMDQEFGELLELLKALSLNRIHVHHTLGLPPSVFRLAEELGIPWDFTAHDYYCVCPQIHLIRRNGRYCGESGLEGCRRCLQTRPARNGTDIQTWRDFHARLLAKAERCFAPSLDCANRMKRYIPQAKWQVAYHEPRWLANNPVRRPMPRAPAQPLKILVIGGLSAMKGADLLEAAATDAKVRNLPLTFVLLGYPYRRLRRASKTHLHIRGKYAEADLADLLRKENPQVIWFPAVWPETYSYTLSAALSYGAPIVAPQIGAFPERLAGRQLTWLLPWNGTPAAFNDFFLQLKNDWLHLPRLKNSRLPAPAGMPDFDYQQDYLLPASVANPCPDKSAQTLRRILSHHLTTPLKQTPLSTSRRLIFSALCWFKKLYWMDPVVSRIPAAWKTKTKFFLLYPKN